jgi:thiol-disulfide isomerase/thioredoxin
MKSLLVAIFNHRFYPVMVGTLFVVLAYLLARSGVTTLDYAILVAYGLLAYVVWRVLQTRQTGPNSARLVRTMLRDGTQPTLIQFYSSYCVGCMAIKPVVDQLEAEAGTRLRILRLSIDSEPGKTLKSEFDVVFTPTFYYFDKQGNKVRDSIFVLDKAKILYDLEKP